MLEKFEEMYALQNKLNIETNGPAWATTGVTLQGRKINWFRCIFMEAAEAIDSFKGWKHWKDINGAVDYENVKIEETDIAHFVISQHIAECNGAVSMAAQEAYRVYLEVERASSTLDLIDCFEGIIAIASSRQLPLEMFFVTVAQTPDFSMSDLYNLYLGKNTLNKFRQDNGYKDGTYIKSWNGREDNVAMQEILYGDPNITFQGLYDQLSVAYHAVQG